MPNIIDGKKHAQNIKDELKKEIKKTGLTPGLAVVLLGDNPASAAYVRNKRKACEEIGIKSFSHELPVEMKEEELLALIQKLNQDPWVHGILVQLPLPKQIDEAKIIRAIDPEKDVDCFHPENTGLFYAGHARFLPCTPAGIMEILRRENIEIKGKDCVVVGRSNIVGKPIAHLLMQAGGTVTICHSQTRDLKSHTLRADILVAAVGKANLINADMVKPGATVIDVGINRTEDNKLSGDVDFENVKTIAFHITPVPGGVGPMTIACLLLNTWQAARNQ
jgi:methylenetetrahydrofolate dehydrogenase (NADP+)/methenyltetrahydrofolate cyclohydrolase